MRRPFSRAESSSSLMKALNARWKILNQLNPVFLENLAVSDRPADQFVAEFNDDRFTSTSSRQDC
jgi:hypothetical protein